VRISTAKPSDFDQMYALFLARQITAKDLPRNPKSGLYEYPLSEEDFRARMDANFSFVMRDSLGNGVSYALFIPASQARSVQERSSYSDRALAKMLEADPRTIYWDQICQRQGVPLHAGMRLIDTAEFVIRNEGFNGVLGAVPIEPWFNRESFALVTYRGMRCESRVAAERVKLGIFTKQYALLG
jgi:hypothetical protein